MQDAQTAAVKVLIRVLAGHNLDQALAATADHPSPPHARALVQDLSYGVLRHLGLLDAQLEQLLAKPLTDEAVRQLMRVALYQLQFTRAAPHAVVDQAVSACTPLRAVAAKGLVNAVLRAFLRRRSDMASCANASDTAKYSFPQWWVARMRARYPLHADAALRAGNEHPPLKIGRAHV